MSELISVNQIDFSSENLPKIFDSQRKNLKQDIIFLKEDILKDFREIENKLQQDNEKNGNINHNNGAELGDGLGTEQQKQPARRHSGGV